MFESNIIEKLFKIINHNLNIGCQKVSALSFLDYDLFHKLFLKSQIWTKDKKLGFSSEMGQNIINTP